MNSTTFSLYSSVEGFLLFVTLTIVLTRKQTVTNNVVNDKRIRHPEWAKKEKLQSFAGYPITHGNKVSGVLAMFSTRRMQAADFEVLGVFSDQISKELEGLFTAVDFLIPDGTKQ